ncbi:MAG: HAD hydrolase-like protein, partial [Acidobacteria bacterium]|nr:HAD hydrolase-like protein [Acidobacteriota bacterium]
EEVRAHLNTCERSTIASHGYGLHSFRRSLADCFEQLSHTPATPDAHARILAFTEAIASSEIELLPNVAATLNQLHHRHHLVLVTKGDVTEQTGKLERSGLRHLFHAVEVLAEKTPDAYRDLILRHHTDPTSTWMIGNSPKSDINPALAAGLHAVFIPHDSTWILEHETLDPPTPPQHFLQLKSFADLLQHF